MPFFWNLWGKGNYEVLRLMFEQLEKHKIYSKWLSKQILNSLKIRFKLFKENEEKIILSMNYICNNILNNNFDKEIIKDVTDIIVDNGKSSGILKRIPAKESKVLVNLISSLKVLPENDKKTLLKYFIRKGIDKHLIKEAEKEFTYL